MPTIGATITPVTVTMRPRAVTRKLPRTDEVLTFYVAAEYEPLSRPTSSPHWRVTDIADELAYAVSYKRGLFNGEQKPRKPAAWAMSGVTTQGQKP